MRSRKKQNLAKYLVWLANESNAFCNVLGLKDWLGDDTIGWELGMMLMGLCLISSKNTGNNEMNLRSK